MSIDYDSCQIDFSIQRSGHPGVDVYHGVVHVNEEGSNYYASGHIVNDSGDKGIVNLIKYCTGIDNDKKHCTECDLEVILNDSNSSRYVFSMLSENDTCLMCDESNVLLMMKPFRKVEIQGDAVVALDIYGCVNT
ncbi:hypothetical protein DRF75_02025 [Ehrlichia minasensis]|uniref:Uncharacterized protein n=1 Tax=Ehrlichia minasensis TaxID=1242993 RepID=A0A4Q6IA05_9RICK|nr:hypothetical protein [Ehrlichia minasensis]RZB12867.1 hypothetical protein DRF75_02025 [Ehrlichia minasensis]CEI85151.1 Uncharacterized protein ehr_00537 [Ehrlichia minasensis]